MTPRNGMNLRQCLVCMGILLLLAASPEAAALNAGQGASPVPDSMIDSDKTIMVAIPLIDAAAPLRYQTASFGLG